MTVTWAGVERLLDELIAFHQQQRTDLSEEHPRNLSRKFDYIKRIMERDKRYPWGAREFFRELRLEGKRLGNERHEIIHGVLRRTGATVFWRSQRVVYEKSNARVQIRDFHSNEIVDILKEINAFSMYISPRIWLLIGNDPSLSPGGNIEEINSELVRPFPPVVIP